MRRLTSITCALALACAAPGCFSLDLDDDGDIDIPPAGGYESDYISCANGRDDDQDGRIDCEDSDCLMNGHCGEQIPILPPVGYENTFETCSNGVDDDLDGQFDCGDRGCQNIFELCCLLEFDDASCSNLLDDDGNGFADCADFSCRNNPYVTVCERETDCSDRRDNDGDRLPDCRDVEDCAEDPACAEMDDDCDNGEDDDGDELTDCDDPSCLGSAACPIETNCDNDVDDNGDGRTDCVDESCHEDPACQGPEMTLEFCMDGFDNDGNDYTDCDDFGCSRSTDPAIMAYCESVTENTLERCRDGIDNDGNDFTDCEDFSCSQSDNELIRSYCQGLEEATLAECSNGVDDDMDGFTDCGDFSCSRDGEPDAVEFCSTISEGTFELCRDGRDNDRNGFADCADFSCRFSLFQRGTYFCETAADCPGSRFTCRDRLLTDPDVRTEPFCHAECEGPDDCPTGWECRARMLDGGVINVCTAVCGVDEDCERGASCFNGLCLTIRGPCAESVFSNEDSNFQGGSDLEDATCGQQLSQSTRACTDGVDGDGDGFTDCEDWECNHNPRARLVPDGMRAADCFVETAEGSTVCTPRTDGAGNPLCPALCRYAGGRTCILGPNAGRSCANDEDCGAISGACGRAGPAGRELVCPR